MRIFRRPRHRVPGTTNVACPHKHRLNLDDRAKSSAFNVKMWRRVIIGVHCNLASGKAVNGWHYAAVI
jgi:hypothetical protein